MLTLHIVCIIHKTYCILISPSCVIDAFLDGGIVTTTTTVATTLMKITANLDPALSLSFSK